MTTTALAAVTTVDTLAGMTAEQLVNDYGYLIDGDSNEIPF